MDMKKALSGIAVLAAAASVCAACSKKNSGSDNQPPVWPAATTEPADPDAKTITWVADYDINPSDGKERSTALALFEDIYGGKINFVYAKTDDITSKIDSMISGGKEVDMIPFRASDFPCGVIDNRCQPLDPYFEELDMGNDELWGTMRSTIDAFTYKNQHYVLPYSVSEPFLLMYSRKVFKENGFDDPFSLYRKGEWTRSVFIEMMTKFCEGNSRRIGVQGLIGEALLCSTGQTVVEKNGGGLVSNISAKEIADAEEYMKMLSDKRLYVSSGKELIQYFPTNHNTLFYASHGWSLGMSNAKNEDAELMVVPIPRADDSDKNYFTGTYNAKLLAAGSKKGEIVATYIKCERLAASNEKFIKAERDAALERTKGADGKFRSYITAEQYDAMKSFCDLEKFTPLVDFGYGMGEKMSGMGVYTYESLGVMDKLGYAFLEYPGKAESWEKLRDSVKDVIEKEIANY